MMTARRFSAQCFSTEAGDEEGMSSCSLGRLNSDFKKDKCPLLLTTLSPWGKDNPCSLIDVSSMTFRDAMIADFKDATCILSKGKWLLMQRERMQSLFLVNPTTGSKYELPRLQGDLQGKFTFSLVLGVPDRVIHAYDKHNLLHSSVTIQVLHLGNKTWKVHHCGSLNRSTSTGAVALVGNVVMCLNKHGPGGVALDLSKGSWWVVPPPNRFPFGPAHFVESNEEVVRAALAEPHFDTYKFQKLDVRSMGWVDLNGLELENTSWFLDGTRSFCARGKGKKVYTLEPNRFTTPKCLYPDWAPPDPDSCLYTDLKLRDSDNCKGMIVNRVEVVPWECADTTPMSNVYVHNLEDGTSESLWHKPFITEDRCWVGADAFPMRYGSSLVQMKS